MEFFTEYKTEIAALFIRLVLGFLFFFQGYEKIFRIGIKQTEDAVAGAMLRTSLPPSLVRAVALISSITELSCGILLIAGWMIYPSLILLSVNLLLVVFAMSLRESLWDMRFVWPRIVLVAALFLLPENSHLISLDHILNTYGTAITTG